MDRPYVFCHMMVSMNGKIMGRYMDTPEGEAAGDVFDQLIFGDTKFYTMDGDILGRVTTDDNFTLYEKPELDDNATEVPAGDFHAPHDTAPYYYISVDPQGRLGWKENTVDYHGKAHVLEVLTGKASNAYKAFLRRKNISYMIAGEETMDLALMLQKLKEDWHMKTVKLGGGGVLNWSFMQAGLCDEVSLVMTAAADGNLKTQTLFDMREGLTDDTPVEFKLLDVKKLGDNTVWLRYKPVTAGTEA